MWLNLRDAEAAGRQALAGRNPSALGYYASGADDQTTLADNEAAMRRYVLRPRVLVDVSSVDTRLTLLGLSLAAPILVAPMALQRLAHPDGEAAVARAAAAAGLGYCLSTMATTSLEEVAPLAAGRAPQLFQLYVLRDRALTAQLVARAAAAGYSALVVTVDAPLLGRREADVASGFTLPEGLELANLRDAIAPLSRHQKEGSALFAWFASQVDASLTWRDIAWLRSLTRLPLLLKGILTGEDAARAVAAGVDGIVVSNHGGRQLDGVAAALDALPEVVAAVGGRMPVLVDGGFRRGGDVLKALGLGASAVLVGRPCLWGLAAGGEAGVAAVLGMLVRELRLAMALAGCPDCASVGPWVVRARGGVGGGGEGGAAIRAGAEHARARL